MPKNYNQLLFPEDNPYSDVSHSPYDTRFDWEGNKQALTEEMEHLFWETVFEHDVDGNRFQEVLDNHHMVEASKMIEDMPNIEFNLEYGFDKMENTYKKFHEALRQFEIEMMGGEDKFNDDLLLD